MEAAIGSGAEGIVGGDEDAVEESDAADRGDLAGGRDADKPAQTNGCVLHAIPHAEIEEDDVCPRGDACHAECALAVGDRGDGTRPVDAGDRQLDALGAAECERIFQDTASGADAIRPGLVACLDHLRRNDVLVVLDLDRLGR